MSRPRRQAGGAVVPQQRCIAGVEHRVIERGVGDARFEIIRDDELGNAAQEGEQTDMRR